MIAILIARQRPRRQTRATHAQRHGRVMPPPEEVQSVMLLAESQQAADNLASDLGNLGVHVRDAVGVCEPTWRQRCQTNNDPLLICALRPSPGLFDGLEKINATRPRPVVMFTDDPDRSAMNQAIRVGVSAYVVQGFSLQRVASVIDLAVARFNEMQDLRSQLQAMKDSLAQRKLVERAKGLIMRQRKCEEDEAYRVLQKSAMDQKKSIAEVAKDVILISPMLEPGQSK